MTSLQKAEKFAALAAEKGWEPKIDGSEMVDNGRVDLTITRGEESISMWWMENSMTEGPIYRLNSYETRLRNASAAKKQLDQPPMVDKVARRRKPREDDFVYDVDNIEVDQTYLPFDSIESPNKEVMLAIRGNTIQWVNSFGGFLQATHVPRSKNRNLDLFKVTRNPEGRRIIHFIGDDGGETAFRSVYLDRIVRVG